MEQDNLTAQLTSLERKLKLLLTSYNGLKGEVTQLQAENTELKKTLQSKEEQLGSFQNQIKIGKIVDSIEVEGGDSSELTQRIDEYIKEIDKCIEWFHNY